MDPNRYARVREVYLAVSEPEERHAPEHVRECAADADLRAAVLRLVRAETNPFPAEPGGDNAIALSISRILESHSNYLDSAPSPRHEILRFLQVRHFIVHRQQIEMVILGFPAKSPNRNKTYSDHADLGEVEGLRTLHQICREIASVYAPGAKVHVCSDGHVFADLVHVSDENVDRFQTEVEQIIAHFGFDALQTFSARAVYPTLGGDALRERLVADHADDLATIRKECLETDEGKSLWSGIHRFLFEDDLVLFPQLSRNQVRERSKQRAYEVIQRSQAFSKLVRSCFPTAIRLSIHPHGRGATKLGIRLVPSHDRWATPWHNVLVMTKDGACLMPRSKAEQQGARLRLLDDKFAFYDLVSVAHAEPQG